MLPTDPDPLINTVTVEGLDSDGDTITATDTHTLPIAVSPSVTAVADRYVRPTDTTVTGAVGANDSTTIGTFSLLGAVPNAATTGSLVFSDTGAFTFDPVPTFAGQLSFGYQLCVPASPAAVCGNANVTIIIGPRAFDDTATTPANTTVVIAVLSNDQIAADLADLDSLIVTISPSNGVAVIDHTTGAATYTPIIGFTGTDSFIYNICQSTPSGTTFVEPLCTQATVTILVPNTPPGVNGDNEVGVIVRTIEPGHTPAPLVLVDGEQHRVTITHVVSGSLPPGLTLNPDGTFVGTTAVSGVYPFVVHVCDNGSPVMCSDQPVEIHIADRPLPFTGIDLRLWMAIAALLTFVGGLTVFTARRRTLSS